MSKVSLLISADGAVGFPFEPLVDTITMKDMLAK